MSNKKQWISLDNYKIYESEKQKLQEKNLTPEEYEAEIKKLIDTLKI